MELKNIYSPIENELVEVDSIIKKTLFQSQDDNIIKVASHILQSPGKRIRASLSLLAYYLTCNHLNIDAKNNLAKAIDVAAAIECIHTASLVHDDIIDQSETRRRQQSIYAKWGTNISILMGVYIYAVSLGLLTKTENKDIQICINETVKDLCEGEFIQINDRYNFNNSEPNYLSMIKKKTASLFSAACFCPVRLISDDQKLIKKLYEFGQYFGIIFQITDDYLDLFGEKEDLGKKTGQDLLSGEFTLPFYLLLESLSSNDKKEIETMITTKNPDTLKYIRSKPVDIVDIKIKDILTKYQNEIINTLNIFQDSNYKQSLLNITNLIASRG